MPSLSATMEEGTIVSWRVKEGDRINTGGILAEIESDKSVFEYECPCEGVVRKLLVPEGQSCPVQATIAVVGDEKETIPAEWLSPAAAVGAAALSPSPAASPSAPSAHQPASPSKDRVRISPRARKLAEELGVDIANVSGTGPGGRIESSDIENAAREGKGGGKGVGDLLCAAPEGPFRQKVPAPFFRVAPLSPIRARIVRKVTQSKREIPHFYVSLMVDMTAAAAHREAGGKRVSFNALLMRAIVAGLQAEPSLNVALTEAGYVPHKSIDIGLAVETPEGVVIGVIEDVAHCDDAALMNRIGAAVDALRRGDMAAVKTSGACMTISNIGMFRADLFIPIIHPGEAAILGVGTLAQRPAVVAGALAVRQTMPLTLCVDHRIVDGAVASRFLAALAGYLEGIRD
jgi:pyruvate dehydrogenase E2 component (dihydrolipoamide acetyltransferase)